MTKLEKILTQEQKEDIILFVYNMVHDGYPLSFVKERHLISENDDYACKIVTTLFKDKKEIVIIYVDNKITKKSITLELHNMDISNISSYLNYLQNEVNNLIDQNTPTYYSDDEIRYYW